MTGPLFNFMQSASGVRDWLVANGSATLDKAAEVLDLLADASRKGSAFIHQFGPLVQFGTEKDKTDYQGGVASKEAQNYLSQLQEMRSEGLKQIAALSKEHDATMADLQKQIKHGVHQGRLDLGGRLSPEQRKAIWTFLTSLLTSVLTKAGAAPALDTGAASEAPTGKSK